MQKKLLSPLLLSCMLSLTACGGSGSDTSNTGNNTGNGNNNTTSNVDYNKAETVDLIAEHVLALTRSLDNDVLAVARIAEEIHYSTVDPDGEGTKTSCSSGTVQKNSNGSITLTDCKGFKINSQIYQEVADITISGTIQSKPTYTDTSEKYDTTLSNITIKYNDNEVETYNGNIVELLTFNEQTSATTSQYDISQLELIWTEKSEKEQYVLRNYRLTENRNNLNALTSTAKGELTADVNGKKFSVNFDSALGFANYQAEADMQPNSAKIEIADTTNTKNSIKIERATNGQALVSAFVNSTSVTGFPKTVGWNDF